MTLGRAAPLNLTTIRELAHMTSSGDLPRMPQHASVISGTSALSSISGKTVSASGSSASIATPSSANRRAKPRLISASLSPDSRRLATDGWKPLAASQQQPVDRRLPAAPAALRLVHGAAVMVDRDADLQTVAEAAAQRQQRRLHLVHRLHRVGQHQRAEAARQRERRASPAAPGS